MAWDHKAPYDKKNNLMHYPEAYYLKEWKEAGIPRFYRLLFVEWVRGRSAAYAHCKDDKGHLWPVSMHDIGTLLQGGRIHPSEGQSAFYEEMKIVKRGENFFLALTKENP